MEIYKEFLNKYDYDITKTGNARWIDQKCTYDVVSIIADCINEYVETTKVEEFTVSNIWHSNYARTNVIEIFSKPDPENKASNEYDKYFGQPIKLLGYSKILNVRKDKNKYYYSINNREILEKIALRPMNALNFLYEYICKVLSDSGLMNDFTEFFEVQDNDAYKKVKDSFIEFTIRNTNINGKTECGRIFTKVINPLAFKLRKLGTEKGNISKNIITLDDLQYNRLNWRDKLNGKNKFVTRVEHELSHEQLQLDPFSNYTINKAKKNIRKFNDTVYNGMSEINQLSETVGATQAHHIFTQSEYPSIAGFVENLIMLTPNQHLSMAHPNNNTKYIDKDFQYLCLIAKATKIQEDLTSLSEDKFYNFEDYKYVLNTGLGTDDFSPIDDLDFATVIDKIDYFYGDVLEDNKYDYLIQDNKIL